MYEWYEWDSQESFDEWHESIKTLLGLPRMSVDKNSLEVMPMVTSYTRPIEVESKIIARVETKYASGLLITELRPIKPPREDFDL